MKLSDLTCVLIKKKLMSHKILEHYFVVKAKEFAIKLHNDCGHTYNGGPYEFHLQMVVDKLITYEEVLRKDFMLFRSSRASGFEQFFAALIAAGWCHDTLEDCGITYNDLKYATSDVVADIVYDVSDDMGRDRTERRLRTLARTRTNPLATLLKLGDLYSNTSFSKESGSGMFEKYKKEYPMVRYALKNSYWREAWREMDELYEFDKVKEWLGEK